ARADRGAFAANRTRFLARLDDALARWTEALAPYRGTRAVVVHDSWPYFARRFGLVVVAAIEPAPGVPPSASSLAALTQKMRETGVRLLIAEPSSNAALVSQMAARSGARAVVLVPSVGDAPYCYALAFTLGGAALFATSRTRRAPVPQEAIIGIVNAVSAAAAVLVVDQAPQGSEHIKQLLVGNILTVTPAEVGTLALLYAPIAALHWLVRRPLLDVSFDPDGAGARRAVPWWDFGFYASFVLVITRSVSL